MALPIAAQVYSVREDAKADLRGTLEKIKKMGYDGVEFAGLYGNTPADIAKMCKEIGLVPISAHVPYLDMCGAPKGILAKYAEVGCKFVAVPYLTPDYRPGTPCWGEVVENIKMLGEVAKGYGIRNGAVASSVSHDSHNIIVIGDNDRDMALAVDEIIRTQGGYTVVENGEVFETLPLPIMGLMSDAGFESVNETLGRMIKKAHEMGVPADIEPFITLSFLALPVIPTLRITPRGLCLLTAKGPEILQE